jgi:hypothetical protein
MPNYTIRGTITLPFEAQVEADTVTHDFDLANYFGVRREDLGWYALDDVYTADSRIIIDDRSGDYSIDAIEVE